MSQLASQQNKINYVEFPSRNLSASKEFFQQVFGWQFEDFGTEYTAFSNSGLAGGFFLDSDGESHSSKGWPLVVIFSDDLESSLQQVEQAQGEVIEAIFSFPGGRRFHFREPGGNVFGCFGLITR